MQTVRRNLSNLLLFECVNGHIGYDYDTQISYPFYINEIEKLMIQVNLNMTDSMGPGKYLMCIGLGPSISSVICKNLSYSGPSYPSSPVPGMLSILPDDTFNVKQLQKLRRRTSYDNEKLIMAQQFFKLPFHPPDVLSLCHARRILDPMIWVTWREAFISL